MNTFFVGTDSNYYTKGTLAHFLDTRELSYGEPSSSNLPTTINPFTILRNSVFQDRLIIVRVDCSDMDEIPDFKNIDKVLKFCVPADNFLILWVKLPEFSELIQTVTTHEEVLPIQSLEETTESMSLTCNENINVSEI